MTNESPAVAPAPIASSATTRVSGTTVKVDFTLDLDAASIPPPGAFIARLNGDVNSTIGIAPGGVAINGKVLTLTLASPVSDTDTVQMLYAFFSGDTPLQGVTGFRVADFIFQAANKTTKPTAVTANGRTVTLTLDRNVSAVLDSTNEERGSDDLGSAEERLSWAFTVQGAYKDGVRLSNLVPKVAVSGNTVTLTLGRDVAFLPGKDVSVDYAAGFAGRRGAVLQDANGDVVGSFSRGMVANATPGTERPVLTAAQVAGTALTLTFDKALDASSAPAGRRFQVVVHPVNWDGPSRVIHGTGTATVSGQTVTVTLASAVEQGETALATYRKGDEANPLRDAAGTNPEVESFGLTLATVMDRTAPKLHSAASAASLIFLYYNEKLDSNSTPPNTAFAVTVGGSAATVSAVSVLEDAVGLTFSSSGSGAVEVSYTPPGTNPVRDVAGNAAAAFSGQTAPSADTSAAPALTGAETNGDIVTLTFNRALRASHVPAADAFEVLDLQDEQLNQDLTGDFKWGQTIMSVSVRGSTVVLDVSPGVYPCTPSRVSYEKPATNSLRNLGSNEVASFSDQGLTHLNADECVFNAVRGVSMESSGASGNRGRQMSMQFDRSLRRSSLPDKDAFAVTPRNGGAPIEIEKIWIPDDPTRLLMTLSRPMSDGERATASYRPRSSTGLKDTDGNILAPFSAEVTTDEPAAGVTAALVSDPGDDATYAAGDTVRVRLTFFEAVEVDTTQGTPRLKLDLDSDGGSGERWAAYEGGTGTTELTFAYVASSGDMSADGVAVLADTLEPNGGAIKSVATGTAASLGHAGLDHDPAHRVDAEPPRLLRGEIDGGTMTLFFSEALDPDWTGGKFDMAVEVPEQGVTGFRAAGGVTVEGATVTVGMGEPYPRATAGLDRNSVRYSRRADGADGALRDLAGNPVQTPHRSLLHSQGGTVELRYIKIDLVNVTGTGSSVTGVAVVSDAGDDDTYALGETIRVQVTFAEAVEVDTAGGTPRLTIRMDPRWGEFRAAYESGTGTNALTFAYRVAEPNTAPTGIAVLADTLETNGGTITSAATGAALALGHAGLPHDPAHKVDWRLAPVPVAVTGVEVTSDAGADGAYTEGETVEAAVTFDAPVDVDTEGGVPTLALIANDGIRRAAYVSGSGMARLVFAYRVVAADGSLGASVRAAASGLKLNGGAIAAAAGGTAASLAFGETPGVTAVSVGTQDDGRWEAGDTVAVTLTFAEPVVVEGAPSVALSFGGVERRAVYARGSGGARLTFVYTLHEVEIWRGTVGVVADSLSLGGGTILSAGGGLAAVLAHSATESVPARTAPANVTGVAVVSDAGGDRTYGLGDTIRVRVTFDQPVDVSGSPRVKIKMDPRWGEFWAGYASGGGTAALTFAYTVVEPNTAPTGIAVLANTLEANGGTIKSAGTQSDASLAHAGLGHDAAHRVDWRLAPPAEGRPSVTGVAVVSDAGSDDTYLLGDTIRVRLTFSEAVEVTGSPRLTIKMDPRWGEKRAVYEGATGTATLALTFAWTVVEPNYAPQGIAVLVNTLALDGGTIRSAATGADAALGHAGLGHDPKHKVDWRPVLSVADAEAREGVDEAVAFEVSLSRAFTGAGHRVRVSYATADGTAKAGEDYTATSGTLVFVAGETSKTVRVPILDDGHDEGAETFLLRLSNVVGARAGDLEATGTIRNTDRMPKAWLARFGRTVAEQVVDAVGARLDAPRAAGGQATLGGQALPSWAPGSGSAAGAGAGEANDNRPAAAGFVGDAAARRDAERLGRWLAGTDERDDEARANDRSMTGREVLASTAFSLTAAPEDGGASVALWGRGASSSFSGRDGPLTVDGEVTSATLGADWRSGRWLLGAMVKHSIGEGSYSGDGGSGEVENTLTGVYPYAAVDVSARLRAWAAAGLGEGTLTLTPKNPETGADDPALETDMSLGMAALGAKGNLVEPAGGSGFRLDVEADAFWVRTSSEKAPGLATAEADVTRTRLGLDGGYAFALPGAGSDTGEGGGTLEPTFELGLRHDGGDAETGWGVDIGGGIRWADPALGLSAEVAGRGLIAHEAAGLKDRGVSGSLAWDPDPASDRGPSLSLTQTLGAQAAGGADALLGRQTLADLATDDNRFENRRLELRLGYGVGAFGGRFTATPELGVALSDAAREYRFGWRLGLIPGGPSSFDLGIEATRIEPANDAGTGPEHGIRLELGARF